MYPNVLEYNCTKFDASNFDKVCFICLKYKTFILLGKVFLQVSIIANYAFYKSIIETYFLNCLQIIY